MIMRPDTDEHFLSLYIALTLSFLYIGIIRMPMIAQGNS